MELSILDEKGLPEGSILSVRSGPTRRQSPLPCSAPFKLPAGPWPLRIDVLAMLGKSQSGASLANVDAQGRCWVPLEARDGKTMSVTLMVCEGKQGARPKTAENTASRNELEDFGELDGCGLPSSPVRRREPEAEARLYLDRHRLHEFMHALFELLLRERPDDPYAMIASQFHEAAMQERRKAGPPAELPILEKQEQIPNSLCSTTPTSALTLKSEKTAVQLMEEKVEVTVRSMRGCGLACLAVHPREKISVLKERLASHLGVPASSQHLLWWAETLPNDTTLEDHGVPVGPASVHLSIGTRDPRLRSALSGSSDGGLRLWNLRDGELVREIGGGGPSAALAVAVDWKGLRAVSGSFDGRVKLWDLEAGQCLQTMEGHTEEVNTVEVDWPSLRALSGAGDGTAILWGLRDGKRLQTLAAAGGAVYTLAACWAKGRAYAGLRSGVVRFWDLASGTRLADFTTGVAAAEAASSAVSAVAIDCLGQRAVSGLEDGHLAYWHFTPIEDAGASASAAAAGRQGGAATGADAGADAGAAPAAPAAPPPPPATKVLLAHRTAVRAIVAHWSAADSQVLCGSDDGSLSLWRLDSQECLARFARHVGYVWTLAADWAQGRAVSGAFDGCLKLWNLQNGACLRTVQAHARPLRSICVG